ncbi:MAG: site-2 protease family protein [Chloroflexota bacterium]|nr:site-2 protease family protein [Chloroflexota bacterium]
MSLEQLLPSLIAVGVILLVAFPVHEFSHALAAYRLGDSTARYQGRLTLDPRAHLDPLGAVLLLVSALAGAGIGWAKPTPVNWINLAGGRRGEVLVAVAGPLSNLVLATLAAIPYRLVLSSPEAFAAVAEGGPSAFAFAVLSRFFEINVVLFVFNLLPIPPLDGWRALMGLVDARTAYTLRQYEQYGFIAIILLVIIGGGPLLPIARAVAAFLVGA